MSDATTRKMIELYEEDRPVTTGFRSMFRTPAQNFYNSEYVELDIERNQEDIAVVVTDHNGNHVVTLDNYTNKEFKAPAFKPMVPLRANDLLSREPGVEPFADQGSRVKAMRRATRALRTIEAMIDRSIELMCAQCLQGGVIELRDVNGDLLYTLDFGMQASHIITPGTYWDAGGDVLGDISAACEVIRDDSGYDAKTAILGIEAFEAAIANTAFRELLDNRRIDQGAIRPMAEGGTRGFNYRGTVNAGHQKVDLWTYGGRYKDPQTGNSIPYMDPKMVIVLDMDARRDLTFGLVPRFQTPSQVDLSLPTRISSTDTALDMFVNTYTSVSGDTLNVEAASRPLPIPTALDSFANINAVTP